MIYMKGEEELVFIKTLSAMHCYVDTVAVDKTFIWGDYTVIRLTPY